MCIQICRICMNWIITRLRCRRFQFSMFVEILMESCASSIKWISVGYHGGTKVLAIAQRVRANRQQLMGINLYHNYNINFFSFS